MSPSLAHVLHWLEPLLFIPAFTIVLVAIVKDRRARRQQRLEAGGHG